MRSRSRTSLRRLQSRGTWKEPPTAQSLTPSSTVACTSLISLRLGSPKTFMNASPRVLRRKDLSIFGFSKFLMNCLSTSTAWAGLRFNEKTRNKMAEYELALRRKSTTMTYAAAVLRLFGLALALVFLSRLAASSSATAFWSLSVSTR